MLRKVLGCLPRSKWGPKVMVIEEVQDLRTLRLDNPINEFLTHEIHLKEETEEFAST